MSLIETHVAPDAGHFVADEKRVRRILYNLLANAVGFSHRNGLVTISASRANDMIEFAIADQGPGIPRDFIGNVFDRFAAMPRGSARGGVGLGLSIVRSFVLLHGGTVEIESEENIGSTVKVRLPLQAGRLRRRGGIALRRQSRPPDGSTLSDSSAPR